MGQKRKDGSDYITHPVAVTEILLELKMDSDSICAALMHDVLEDCNVQKSNLAKMFGDDVAHIVDGVSKLGKIDLKNVADKNANNLQKMALAMANDVRVILVKLCDRLHNMRTIEFVPRKKQIQKSKETLDLYGPLALRVGMQDIRAELEDRALSSSSALMSCIPTLSANGPYKSKVSFDFCICFFLGTNSMVLILCSLSHNLTKITLTSFAIANAIF